MRVGAACAGWSTPRCCVSSVAFAGRFLLLLPGTCSTCICFPPPPLTNPLGRYQVPPLPLSKVLLLPFERPSIPPPHPTPQMSPWSTQCPAPPPMMPPCCGRATARCPSPCRMRSLCSGALRAGWLLLVFSTAFGVLLGRPCSFPCGTQLAVSLPRQRASPTNCWSTLDSHCRATALPQPAFKPPPERHLPSAAALQVHNRCALLARRCTGPWSLAQRAHRRPSTRPQPAPRVW